MSWGRFLRQRFLARRDRRLESDLSGRHGQSQRSAARREIGRRAALSRAVEPLESRIFMHAGHPHLTPTLLSPYNGQQTVPGSSNITVTFTTDVNTATLTAANFELRDANNALIPAAISYSATAKTATLDPTPTLATTTNYFYVKMKGGATGVKDTAGNELDGDLAWSFTTGTPTFNEAIVFSGLVEPTAVEFSPDGRVFVAEKSGLIKVFSSLSATTPTIFADLRTATHNFWDRGLLGLALDPQFTTGRPYVYALYTYDGDIGGSAPKYGTVNGVSDAGPDATGQGAKVSGRLSRLTANGNTMLAGSEKVLIHDWQQQFPSHSIGSVKFGPDGALYVSAGDGASFNYADYGQTGNPFNDPANQGGALRSLDLLSPNDPTTLDGTIIRVDPDTGNPLPTNPLYNSGNDTNAKRIVAQGFRNPFRMTFRPGTNEIWSGDVGWNTWEEINRLQISSTAVLNYGWPAYEGPNRQSGYDALNLPLIENLYAQGASAVVTPYYAYQHSEKVVANSAEPTGGSSVSGLAFYEGGSYPTAYNNALFFSDYSRKAIYVMYAGPNGLPNLASRQVFKIGRAPAQLTTGPNGDLFYVDMAGGQIRRFTFTSANRPPVANISADRTSGPAPLTVNFSAAGSSDPDAGDTLSYAWDLDNDGQYDDSTAIAPSRTFTQAGAFTVGLRVTDSKGASSTASIVVTPGNTAPVASITSPLATLKWKVGDTITFSGTGTDAQDGTLAGANLKWSLILRHESLLDPSSYHEHPIQDFTGASGSFVAPDHQYPSKLELRLTATDTGGLTHTVTRVLEPQTSVLNFTSNVPSAKISFNEGLYSAPFSQTAIVGSASSVVAVAPQTINGVIYLFDRWSDGGAATHNIIAPAAGGTWTATFVAAASLPQPWIASDIGTVGRSGNDTYQASTGTYTINAAGADIWGTADSFRFVHQQISGDAEITARVISLLETHNNAKAGVQFRQSLAANAANVQMDLEGGQDWAEFHARSTAGGETSTQSLVGPTPGYWVRLRRVGNTFTGFVSPNGTTWQQVSSATVSMTGAIYVGLAVCSHDTTALTTAVFDNVTVTALAANAAPVITTAANATVSADGRTAALTVAASDDAGEANLNYTWSTVSGPGAVSFAPNGTNSSKASTATFTRAGAYVLRGTATDAGGRTASSDVTVNVAQIATAVAVSPNAVTVAAGGTQQFVAVLRDQFNADLAAQPTFTWAVDAGGVGTVSSAGLYAAPGSGTGNATIRATASGKSGTASVIVTVGSSDVTAGLVNRWRFNENAGTATSDSAGGNTGTLTGGAGWTAGVSGSAINLDGVDDHVATGALAGTLGGTATLTAWIKTTQVGTADFWDAPGITGVEQHWGQNDVFWGYLTPNGRIAVKAGDDPAAASTSAVNDGVWHHVAFSRDAATGVLKVYVDGVLQQTVAGGAGVKTVPFASIGRIENTQNPANYLRGALDDVRVYGRVLSDAEVSAVKNAGAV